MIEQKTCKDCGNTHPISFFHKNKKYVDCYCKDCHKIRCRIWHHKNKVLKTDPNFYIEVAGEVWKDVNDFEGVYQVSNFGRVRSIRRKRMINLRLSKSGYLNVSFRKHSKDKLYGFRVARLVAIAFIPNPKGKPYVNHIDAVKTNNHVSNLEWCTQSENIKHAYRIGTKKPSNGTYFHIKK